MKQVEIECKICGTKFFGSSRQKYCSEECVVEGNKIKKKEFIKREKERKQKEELERQDQNRAKRRQINEIEKIAIEARKKGMTYGQYVAQQWLRENQR